MTHRRGFTLIELVIVIAIIGILATLSIPKFIDLSLETKINASKASLGVLRSTLATRYASSATGGATASYPTALLASDFAGGETPKNKTLPDIYTEIRAVAQTEAPQWPMFPYGFWYVSNPAAGPLGRDYGKAGAYGTSPDPSDW